MTKTGAALAALGVFALSSSALASPTKPREAVSVKVSTSDLDLNSPDGVEKLRDRTAQAIAAACSSGERLNTGLSPDWQCRKEMRRDASTKISALNANTSDRLASR